MSKFEGTDFDNVDQKYNVGSIKGKYNAWKTFWDDGDKWGIVGGKEGNKPKTVLETVLMHGDSTYARDQARSIEGLGILLEAMSEIFDGDTLEVQHRQNLQLAVDEMMKTLTQDGGKWNPRNIPFTTVTEFIEGDAGDKPSITRTEVYGHYRTSEYNKYVEWAQENKKDYKGKLAQSDDSWWDEDKGKAKPPLWMAITGEGDGEFGKNGILAIARMAITATDDKKIKIGDGTQIAVFNNSKGPQQLAQLKSVQEKVIEVLQRPDIYPAGKSRAPMKDRLNAAFTGESYAIRNAAEAKLLNFAKGYDRVAGIEKMKSIKLRFPKSNIALNRTIVEVLKVLGENIKQYQTPKAKDGTANPGLVLKQDVKEMNWQDILKNEELEKGKFIDFVENTMTRSPAKFQDNQAAKFFKDTNKEYMQKDNINRVNKTSFWLYVENKYRETNTPLTMQDLQLIKTQIEQSRVKGQQERRRRTANRNFHSRRVD